MPRSSRPLPGQLALFEELVAAPPAAEHLEEPDAAEPAQHSAALAGDEPRPVSPPSLPQPADIPDQLLATVRFPKIKPVDYRRSTSPAGRAAKPPAVPGLTPSPSVTLDEAIPQYLTALAALGRSQHTLKSFELDLRLLRGRLGNRAVGSIDLNHLRQFIAWVRLSRDNAPNSLRRKVATLKNFFGYLHEEGYLPSSPADLLPYPEAYLVLPEFLEEDDAARLVEATEGNTFWRALVLLMLDTGLKRDEVLALRVADVHLEPAPSVDAHAKSAPSVDAHVEPTTSAAGHPASLSHGGSYLVVRETDAAKRLRSRKLPLPPRLRDALRDYYATVPRPDGESRVFDVSVRGINFIVETCGGRAGIVTSKPRLTPQVLRETFAVNQMRARVREERRRQEEGWKGEQMQLLALQHDAEVLDLLGLKDDPDTARKYRQLVKV